MPSGPWLYSYMTLWLLLLVVSALLIAVLRQLKELHAYWVKNDPDWGLPLGALAPALTGEDMYARPLSVAADRGKKTLLLFLSRGCKSCRNTILLLPTLRDEEDLEIVLIVSAGALETRLFLAEFQRDEVFPEVLVVSDADHKLMDQYKIVSVPYAVVVDEEERIEAKGGAATLSEIASLLRQPDEPLEDQGRKTTLEMPAVPGEAEAARPEPAGV